MRRICSLIAIILLMAGKAHAQSFTVDGEEIADAKLYAAAKKEGTLTIYGTIPTEAMSVTLEQFQKDSGIPYEYIRQGSSKMYDRVNAEASAHKLEADYIGLTDPVLAEEWVKNGILADYKVPSFDQIPADLKEAGAHWYYMVRPITVMAVNTALVEEKDYPTSWKALYDPKWKGRFGIQTMDGGGAALSLYAYLRLKIDPQSWEKIAANEPRIYSTASPTVNDLVRGRVAMAVSGASIFTEAIENGAPIKIIFPTEGLSAFGEVGNVTTTAAHPNAARVYVNYLTSKRGSTMVSRQGAYGIHPQAPAPVKSGYTFPAPAQVWNVSLEDWSKSSQTWIQEWKDTFEKK